MPADELTPDPEDQPQGAPQMGLARVRTYKGTQLEPMTFARKTLLYRVKMGMNVSAIEMAVLMLFVSTRTIEQIVAARGDAAERKFYIEAHEWADKNVLTSEDEEEILTIAKDILDEIDHVERITIAPDVATGTPPPKKKATTSQRKRSSTS